MHRLRRLLSRRMARGYYFYHQPRVLRGIENDHNGLLPEQIIIIYLTILEERWFATLPVEVTRARCAVEMYTCTSPVVYSKFWDSIH